jgi:cyclohexyl-isocyanide hydratase
MSTEPTVSATIQIGLLLFPNVTQLDLTGPAQVLSRVPGARVHLAWKSTAPVMTDAGFAICPTTAFADCPQFDVLCVPGGFGMKELLDDEETLAFLRRQAQGARWVTSVCNGALVLGAAGLLRGYRSACHWRWRRYLPAFGAIPTAGIDFAFALAAELAGEEAAKLIQLALEYDPHPPFDCGTPQQAGPERVARYEAGLAARLPAAEEAIRRAALA